jgi:sporulation protein YlmC with PRC-barrel domain
VTAGQVLHAGLHLLDRQVRDRHGRLCGKVDDLEIERVSDGPIYVTAILTGPGHLLYRMGRRHLGGWLEQLTVHIERSSLDDPGRIPYHHVSHIGTTVDLAIDADDVATFAAERWTRDHVIGHIPGSRRVEDQ